MKHEINIAPTKSDGIVEIAEVKNVGVFKQDGKTCIRFEVKDTKNLKHVFNFDVNTEPQVGAGTKIKVTFTTTADQDFAEIVGGAARPAAAEPKKEFPKAVPQQPAAPQFPLKDKPAAKEQAKSDNGEEPFISFEPS